MTPQVLEANPHVVDDLGRVYEHSPWVAEQAWLERSFRSVEALWAAMQRTVKKADREAQLDYLASRAEADAEGEAASAVEGHDGVRIMTVHSAKGLEFGVVAVPNLSRRLLAGSRLPPLTLGHEGERPRVGMQLRRLGAASLNLYAHDELCAETRRREAAEELRLFHVAATRARERLILSGVAMPQPGRETQAGTAVIERILDGTAPRQVREAAARTQCQNNLHQIAIAHAIGPVRLHERRARLRL